MKRYLAFYLLLLGVFIATFTGCRGAIGNYPVEQITGTSTISGKVTQTNVATSLRANGSPIPVKALVWLEERPDLQAETDDEGNYSIHGVPAGIFRVVAKMLHSGNIYKNRSMQTTLGNLETRSIDIVISLAANVVKGVLRDSEGNFLPPGTKLFLWGEEFTVGNNGEFTSPALPDFDNIEDAINEIVVNPGQANEFRIPVLFVSDDQPSEIDLRVPATVADLPVFPRAALAALDGFKVIREIDAGAQTVLRAMVYPDDTAASNIIWSSNGGTFGEVITSNASFRERTWTAPNVGGTVIITVEVRNAGKSAIARLPIKVKAPSAPPPPDQFTVTFNKNGAQTEASPDTETVVSGGHIAALPTAPGYAGHIFVGWNTAADGTGTAFDATTTVNSNIEVFAQWSEIARVVAVTSTKADGLYPAGTEVDVAVQFNVAVRVTGFPQLTLAAGSTTRNAVYLSGSETNTLIFRYTVQAGDVNADLDYSSNSSLVLNGGTIKNVLSYDAVLTLAAPGAAGSLAAGKNIGVDGVAPTYSVAYYLGADPLSLGDHNENITVKVTFSEPVQEGIIPKIALTGVSGSEISAANLTRTNATTYTYPWTVGAGVGVLTPEITLAKDLAGNVVTDTGSTKTTIKINQEFAGGSGTESDPWQITKSRHLSNVRNYVSATHADKFFKLMNDIDLAAYVAVDGPEYNGGEGWRPIGNNFDDGPHRMFYGSFDGNDKTISNLKINRTALANLDDNQGLFGYVYQGKIRNLNLVDVDVKGRDRVGGLVGRAVGDAENAIIQNCTVTGTVVSDLQNAGGVVGRILKATVSNCGFNGTVTGSARVGGVSGNAENSSFTQCSSVGSVTATADTSYVGGLLGVIFDSSTVSDCHSTCSVTGNEYAGGLLGYIELTDVTESHFDGTVTGKYGVGGLIAYASSGTVSNCYNNGSVLSNQTGYYLGGLIGYSQAVVANCYNKGSVTSTVAGNYAGGLIGFANKSVAKSFNTGTVISSGNQVAGLIGATWLDGSGSVSDCYNTGNITGAVAVGGLIADNTGAVNFCYSTGAISASSSGGALIGVLNGGAVSSSYYNTASYGASAGGTAKTEAELKQQATFTGWDFPNIWQINEDTSFPYFKAPYFVQNPAPGS